MSTSLTEPAAAEPLRSVAEYPLPHGKLVLALQGDPPPWVEPILRKLGELLQLPANWNSYGARPVEPSCALAVLPLLVAIMREDSPPPAVVPTSRGGVQLEWHMQGIDLEIEVVAPNRFAVSYEDAKTGEAWDKEVTTEVAEIASHVAKLSLPLRNSRP